MQLTDWTPEHSECLRQLLASGLSYARIADAINAKFNTSYSRNATLGRARRLGFVDSERSSDTLRLQQAAKPPRLGKIREPASAWRRPFMPVLEVAEIPEIRCVEVDPRHLSLLELQHRDCRYPYGGDAEGEAITFCGHPRRPGTSYCAPHFDLTREPGVPPERAAAPVPLRLVQGARACGHAASETT